MIDLKNEHLVLLDLLDRVQTIFLKNNLRYFLIGGSAIGAVRDQGIIPWDDDIDIGVPRKYYDSMISILERDKDFLLYKPSVDDKYILTFLKVVQHVDGQNLVDSETNINGAYIDIFPLDHTSNNKYLRKIHNLQFRLGHKIVIAKTKPKFLGKHKYINKILVASVKYIPIKSIYWFRDQFIFSGEYIFKNSQTFYNFGTPYPMDREIYFYKEIKDVVILRFSNRNVPVPKGYDAILKRTYGDYMKVPKKENQIQKHLSKE